MSDPHEQALAQWLAAQARGAEPLVVGINGAQGSGKSTLSLVLQRLLAEQHGLRCVILALDDLYLGREERLRLAATVHPLLRTRGVPGTHEVDLGARLLQQLRQLRSEDPPVPLPRFLKRLDKRAAEDAWPRIGGPLDVILFEGWCVGTPPQDEAALREPVNPLEALEDAEGHWRHYANQQLAGSYQALFNPISKLIFLRAPDFDSIFRWRLQQEAQNEAEPGPAAHSTQAMGPEQLKRFIQHYQRLTQHALKVMPERADVVLELGPEHEVRGLRFGGNSRDGDAVPP
jgi:D-glycerate 3-kinase